MKQNMKKLIIVFFIIISSSSTCFGSPVSSIEADYSNKVFDIQLKDGGYSFSEQRKEYNNKLLEDKATKNISLYDRFGGNISFIPYYGEKKFNLNIADKFYSNLKENNGEFKFSLEDVLGENQASIQNAVYDGRPDILEDKVIDKGSVDPRRDNYSIFHDAGGDASVGNFYLSASKLLTSTTNFFLSSKLFVIISEQWEMLMKSGFITNTMQVIRNLMPLVIVGFVFQIFKLLRKFMNYTASFKDIIATLINFFICLGIIYTMFLNPNLLNNISKTFITGIDNIFAYSMNVSSSEIAKSDDSTNIVEANIWSKSVFEPWCMGMFDGRKYEELYTQYAKVDNNKKLPQSFEDIKTEWSGNKKKYSSATLTGDIKIPIGPNNYVQNWAALAWSTQSKYHINAVQKEEKDEEVIENYTWPVAERTPYNPDIYVDNFRWIDAKMNISPGYTAPDKNDSNYVKSNNYTHSFTLYGFLSLWRSILLIPILYVSIKRTFSMLKIILTMIRWGIRSIMSIFKEDRDFTMKANFNQIKMPFKMYFWWSLVLFMMVTMYQMLVGNILSDTLWIFISLTIIKFKPPTNMDEFYELRVQLKRQFNNIKKNVNNSLRRG